MNFHRNATLLFGVAFFGYVALTILIAIVPAIQTQETPPTPGLKPLTAEEVRGRELYVSEGCSYCHTQQVRPLKPDQPFGRPSAAGDYAYSTPQLLGTGRIGPDLANIGNRVPDETWHLIHLYNPRAVVPNSVMPAFRWYFDLKDHDDPGDVVVPLPAPYSVPGKVIVARREAVALAAYLLSLKQPRLDLRAFGTAEAAAAPEAPGAAPAGAPGVDWQTLGAQTYAKCAICHQAEGQGLEGTAPPLKGDPVVVARDPAEHIRIVVFGLEGKAVSGKQFAGKMPAFGELLTDEEIAAVINHERTNWGNRAPTVTPEDVKKIREK